MKRFWLICAVMLVVGIIADLLRGFGHHDGLMDVSFPGMWSLFGFISCVLIILLSKYLGHHWLQRPEDYYDKDKGDDELE